MGKHKDQPPLADWEVRLLTGSTVTVAQAWHERVKRDYVFHDERGVCYTFPVRTVAWIGRDTLTRHEATGIIVPNALNAGMISECRCGEKFAGVSEHNARELLAWHIAYPGQGWDPAGATRAWAGAVGSGGAGNGDYSEAAR